jgi:hypothetical protein
VRDQRLREIAGQYVRQNACIMDLTDPKGAAEKCAIATQDLAERYAATGASAVRIRLHGRNGAPPVPHGAPEPVHYVVLVDYADVVDVTRRQFDLTCDVPTIYPSLEAVAQHWTDWSPDDHPHTRRPLRTPQPRPRATELGALTDGSDEG